MAMRREFDAAALLLPPCQCRVSLGHFVLNAATNFAGTAITTTKRLKFQPDFAIPFIGARFE